MTDGRKRTQVDSTIIVTEGQSASALSSSSSTTDREREGDVTSTSTNQQHNGQQLLPSPFLPMNYLFTIYENATKNTTVGYVVARDRESNSLPVRFELRVRCYFQNICCGIRNVSSKKSFSRANSPPTTQLLFPPFLLFSTKDKFIMSSSRLVGDIHDCCFVVSLFFLSSFLLKKHQQGSDKFAIRYIIGPRGTSKAEIVLVQPLDYERQNLYALTVLAIVSSKVNSSAIIIVLFELTCHPSG